MNISFNFLKQSALRLSAIGLAATILAGCSALLPANSPTPLRYSFDNAQPIIPNASRPKSTAPTLILNMPHAAAGFDSDKIIYVRQQHQLDHFQKSLWVDTPANMLAPLITAALERSGQFNAVLQSPTSGAGQLRLDVEIVRLQQEFFSVPSKVHFTLRAHLLDAETHRIVAWRDFDVLVPSASEDTYGGIVAANNAVRSVVTELVSFCAQAVNAM